MTARPKRDEPARYHPRLTELACSVSDRQTVDWAAASAERLGPGLEGLRTLDRLATAFEIDRSPKPEIEPLFRWGPLEALEKIGEGQFGEVYRAWDPNLTRQVALKLGHSGPRRSDMPRKRLDEARRLARVRHPNVLTVFGAAVHDGRAGIWTDLLAGSTLEERLENDGTFGSGELVLVGTELCRALAAVHDAGLVHGDVKTSNVVRELGGGLVLVDFGAAHAPRDGTPLVIQGTPSYLAPELALGQSSPTPGTDLYALGALLYRLATGNFWRGADSKPLSDVRPDLPTELVTAIEPLLAELAEDRPRSAGEAMQRLTDTVQTDTLQTDTVQTGTPRADMPQTSHRQPKRHRRVLWAALAATLATALALWRIQAPEPPSPPQPLSLQLSSLRGDVEIPLDRGSFIRPGDRLNLHLELAEPTHVYVLNEDMAGDLFVLFPLPGLESQNPLAAGAHRLPGFQAGAEQSWEVTSAGGTETFLVIGSATEMLAVDRFLEHRDRARPERQIKKHAGSGDTLRGVGGLRPSTPPAGGATLIQLQESLATGTGRLWTQFLVLENPR